MDEDTKDLYRELHAILLNYHDINSHGGPNDAMRGTGILEEIQGRHEAEIQAHECTRKDFDELYDAGMWERGG